MTAEFRELADKAARHELPSLNPDTAVVNSEAICLYQIATSLCEIKIVLSDIKRVLDKRR